MPRSQTLDNQIKILSEEPAKSSSSGKQAARELLLLASTASISPEIKAKISQILAGTMDWKCLFDLAEFHGVTPLIAYNLINNGLTSQVPKPYIQRLNKTYKNNLTRNMLFSSELDKVLSVFRQQGIETISLKGTVLAEQLYGNPGVRTTFDIDILVKPEKISPASALLLEMGYKQSVKKQDMDHPFHKVYYRQNQFPICIELHWNLDDPKLMDVPLWEIWRRAQPLRLQACTVMILSPEDNLMYLANNLTKQDGHQLRSLCDITELLKKYEGILDWDYIIKSARLSGMKTATYYCLRRARELLGAPVSLSLVKKLKPELWRRWLLNFLVSQETFVTPIKWDKLRREMSTLFHSLMMSQLRQTLAVLCDHRGHGKIAAWLKTILWIVLVFAATLWHNAANILRT